MTTHTQEFLGTKAVSDWTGIPEETLRYFRHRGEGPLSFKLGRRVVYDRRDVERWIETQRAATVSGSAA
jgi:predicted DNA-binding transcriptional regulator AlpA